MNQTLRVNLGTDSIVRSWPAVVAVEPAAYLGTITSDRLKAFKTRFAPSRESLARKAGNYALTAGIYAAIAFAAVQAGTANLTPLLHALHLNGV